ncbi:hypothetical protein D3C87_1772960 [compost metagenome]
MAFQLPYQVEAVGQFVKRILVVQIIAERPFVVPDRILVFTPVLVSLPDLEIDFIAVLYPAEQVFENFNRLFIFSHHIGYRHLHERNFDVAGMKQRGALQYFEG